MEGLRQKPTQMERIRWEGQNFFEVVAPQEEEEDTSYLLDGILGKHICIDVKSL